MSDRDDFVAWTQSRDVSGLKFPKIMFFDGQGFVVSKRTKASKIADLNNATICTLQGSTSELIVASYFGTHKLKYKIVTFASAVPWPRASRALARMTARWALSSCSRISMSPL